MIVAIEGMDGVGKTTVAKSIEKKLQFKYLKEPLKELFELDDQHILKISEKIFSSQNPKLISWYLGLGDSYALSNYKNSNIVMDRHILLNYFWNGNDNTEDIFKMEIEMFGKPDITILLVATPETRMKRIASRNPNDPDLNKLTMKEYGYDKMIAFLNRYHYNYVIIDTEAHSIEETIKECLKVIKKFNKKEKNK